MKLIILTREFAAEIWHESLSNKDLIRKNSTRVFRKLLIGLWVFLFIIWLSICYFYVLWSSIAHGQKDSKDAVELLFQSAALLMCDGSLDVRQQAKRIFSVLKELQDFQAILRSAVPNQVSQKIRKQLENLQPALTENSST